CDRVWPRRVRDTARVCVAHDSAESLTAGFLPARRLSSARGEKRAEEFRLRKTSTQLHHKPPCKVEPSSH
ncbi:hypothetical protein BaRGS_00010590, partial [Batillaria attramentaria]